MNEVHDILLAGCLKDRNFQIHPGENWQRRGSTFYRKVEIVLVFIIS